MIGPPVKPVKRFKLVVPVEPPPEANRDEIPSIRQAMLFIYFHRRILVIRNKETGVITGIGGNLDPGETPYDAAARYLYEYGLRCIKLHLLGLIELDLNYGREKFHVYILATNAVFGRLRETEDGLPIWVSYTDIPYKQMPEDYAFWMPLLLQKLKFKGSFQNENKKVLDHYKIDVIYKGPERNRDKKFGRPPFYKWQDIDDDDFAVNFIDSLDLDNPYKNVIGKLDSDVEDIFEDIDVFSHMKADINGASGDDRKKG